LQDLTNFTQIWIFGLKTNHLATLCATSFKEKLGSGGGHEEQGCQIVLGSTYQKGKKCTISP
jgi:hypothetical protein